MVLVCAGVDDCRLQGVVESGINGGKLRKKGVYRLAGNTVHCTVFQTWAGRDEVLFWNLHFWSLRMCPPNSHDIHKMNIGFPELTRLLRYGSASLSESEHYNLLFDVLGHDSDSSLPSAFSEAVIKGINEVCLVDDVAIACEEINNPLIIASYTKDFALS
nr:DNA helicase, UvrD/REP type, P-loop containing nucleoside triphosphate hydrolase [Tanacetum cinerariifolium]